MRGTVTCIIIHDLDIPLIVEIYRVDEIIIVIIIGLKPGIFSYPVNFQDLVLRVSFTPLVMYVVQFGDEFHLI